jgi:hypothetical protein
MTKPVAPTLVFAVACFVAAEAAIVPAQAQTPAPAPSAREGDGGRVQVDVIGRYHYSRYNFTDLKHPYDGIDGFTVLRLGVWLDRGRRVGVFADVLPVVTTEPEFFFQRHVQFNAGAQWYPLSPPGGTAGRLLRPVRLFAQVSRRVTYDNPDQVDLEETDVEAGFDYYFDNLFEASPIAAFLFTTLTYRTTNFSFDGYDGLLWSGNVTAGPKIALGASSLVPYAVADWTYSPRYESRFFENFFRAGGGARWYPLPKQGRPAGFGTDLARRLHIFAEVVQNVAWLGDAPPEGVEGHDIRIGVAFATGGFFRETR